MIFARKIFFSKFLFFFGGGGGKWPSYPLLLLPPVSYTRMPASKMGFNRLHHLVSVTLEGTKRKYLNVWPSQADASSRFSHPGPEREQHLPSSHLRPWRLPAAPGAINFSGSTKSRSP